MQAAYERAEAARSRSSSTIAAAHAAPDAGDDHASSVRDAPVPGSPSEPQVGDEAFAGRARKDSTSSGASRWILAGGIALAMVIGLLLFLASQADTRTASETAAAYHAPATSPEHTLPEPPSPLVPVHPPSNPTTAQVYDSWGRQYSVPIEDYETAVCDGGHKPGPDSPAVEFKAGAEPKSRRIYCVCARRKLWLIYDLIGMLRLVTHSKRQEMSWYGGAKDALAWRSQKSIDPALCLQALNNGPAM